MALFGSKKTRNWDLIRNQKDSEKLKYRDVYEDQQLERGSIQKKATMTSRNILNGCLTALIFLIVWCLVSLWDMATMGTGGLERSRNPADVWFHVNEHYVNVDDETDKITVDEYNSLVATFASAPRVPEVPNPGDPPVRGNIDEMFEYSAEKGNTPWHNLETDTWVTEAEYETYKDNYDAIFADRMAKYNQDLAAYEQYLATVNDPSVRYKHQKEHYRNGFNPEEYILVDDYQKLVEDYQTQVRRGKLTDEEKNIPAQPIKMSEFYQPYQYGVVPKRTEEELAADTSGGDQSSDDPRVPDETLVLPDIGGQDPREVYVEDYTGGLNFPWKNKYDESKISDEVYRALCEKYDAEHGGGTASELPSDDTGTPIGNDGLPDIGDQDPREVYVQDWTGGLNTPWMNQYDGSKISDETYQALCEKYDAAHGGASQVPVDTEPSEQAGTPSEPAQPSEPVSTVGMNPREVYEFDVAGDSGAPWRNKYTGERITNEQMLALCDAYEAVYGNDDVSVDTGSVQDPGPGEAPADVPEGMEYGPVNYRNIYDGSVITYTEFRAMEVQYKRDVETYKTVYEAHRRQYHADDIDGTKKVFTMRPTANKFLISFVFSALFFAILWYILKKNLDAQNLMSDTSDINQYHNDQHVALPEEVQRAYDWFPDVGAHSAVQVSSMISHMALLNKGLKKVQLAKRAEKDIRDADGDIEYYKGEILMDAEGKPITETVPIIDEKFMEDLFDASGASKDKDVRRRYDTTDIPYNPDGSNRDKLGKFKTVADLINEDWEFPIYEPQRPAGAYIVDTAPVNTMV